MVEGGEGSVLVASYILLLFYYVDCIITTSHITDRVAYIHTKCVLNLKELCVEKIRRKLQGLTT